jgi:hypothetical protein
MDNRKTIAFSKDAAEDLNRLAGDIDSRLFLFAYYRPEPFLENESAMCRFYTAIFNLYGLFWDCGPFIRTKLLNNSNSSKGILLACDSRGNLTLQAKDMHGKCDMLFRWTNGIRQMACHNHSLKFSSNISNVEHAEEFFGIISPTVLKWVSNGWEVKASESEWEKCLDEICNQASIVEGVIRQVLGRFAGLTQEAKKKIIKRWLEEGIANWYIGLEVEMRAFLIALKDLYDQKAGRIQDPSFKRWLQIRFGANGTDKWLNLARLHTLLDSGSCPKPALPVEVFDALTSDVKRAAMSGGVTC